MDKYYVTVLCPDGTWAELFLTEEEAGKLDAFCTVTLGQPLIQSKVLPKEGEYVRVWDEVNGERVRRTFQVYAIRNRSYVTYADNGQVMILDEDMMKDASIVQGF